MSNLPGNPWIDYATHNMQMAGAANNNGDYSRSQMLSREASTNATLALAYEQRTANLIAYIETFGGGIEYDTIRAGIRARLGLEAPSE